jgi:hypothetical protein
MLKLRALAAVGVAAASLAFGAVTTTSASAAPAGPTDPVCTTWNDSNTFGGYCSKAPGSAYFRAWALCNNGTTVYGQWMTVGNGNWSYAYCTSVNSSLNTCGVSTS